jgi:hypothetical protein
VGKGILHRGWVTSNRNPTERIGHVLCSTSHVLPILYSTVRSTEGKTDPQFSAGGSRGVKRRRLK